LDLILFQEETRKVDHNSTFSFSLVGYWIMNQGKTPEQLLALKHSLHGLRSCSKGPT